MEYTADVPLPNRRKQILIRVLLTSLAVHIVGLAIFGSFVVFRRAFDDEVAFKPPPQVPRIEPKKLQYKMRLKQQQEKSSRPQIQPRLMSTRVSEIAMPEIKVELAPVKTRSLSNLSGMGQGIGTGFGSGSGSGSGFGGIPEFSQRCSPAERAQRMAQMGGKPTTEAAVISGLRYLVKTQSADGSWGKEHPQAMTGLALLAFLAHCERPGSPEFGVTVDKAIGYLVTSADGSGRLTKQLSANPGAYEHAIATYALAEAYGLTRQERIGPVVLRAARIIVTGQTGAGGWNYKYDKGNRNDLSVAGWQMQALKATQLAGLNVPGLSTAMSKGARWVGTMQGSNGAFGYTKPEEARYSLTGVGVLALQVGKKGDQKAARDGLDFIIQAPPVTYSGKDADLYAYYYNTQACFNAGGKWWSAWNAMYQDQIVGAQSSDGGWPPTGGNEHGGMNSNSADGNTYRTALCCLMLEVYYRYLPTYAK